MKKSFEQNNEQNLTTQKTGDENMITNTESKFVSLEAKEVVSVYSGRKEGCRCGCLGKYSYAKAFQKFGSLERGYAVDDEDVNDKAVKTIVNILNANASRSEITDGYIVNIEMENGHVYTAYLVPREIATTSHERFCQIAESLGFSEKVGDADYIMIKSDEKETFCLHYVPFAKKTLYSKV